MSRSKTQGATWNEAERRWHGWYWDGKNLHTFESRLDRERALDDARKHRERLDNPAKPKKVWRG